ncbi:MAG: PEGA domain-containing protein, partial [Verrucomicrobiae bacterium]|nr:PEGA domain-containing protein [Verrucomicrobiae bacterium]
EKSAVSAPQTPVQKPVSQVFEEEKERNILGIVFGSLVALFILGGAAFLYFQSNRPVPAPVPVPISKKQEEIPAEAETPVEVAAVEETQTSPQAIVRPAEEPEAAVESIDLFSNVPAETTSLTQIESEEPEIHIPLGTMAIRSVPSGASVFVNGKSKGHTPLTIDELQFGQYSVEFKLEGYVPQLLDVSLNSEEVENVETQLQLPLGTLEIDTTPTGVSFEVISVSGLDRIIQSGVTPAKIPDVLQGDYEVVFKRDNWEDYSERVQVRYNDISHVDLVYPEGWLMITSTPDNASVFERGKFVGKTPLRLKGLKEGEKHYTIRHLGFEDYETSATIVAQNEAKIDAELLSWDREVNYNDLDVPPAQLKHSLTYTQRLVGSDSHRFVVEFVINKEGIPEQIEVLETTYLRAHERLIKDISKWEFEPGMRKDHAVKTRVRLPIILGDVAKLPPAVELARTEKEEE